MQVLKIRVNNGKSKLSESDKEYIKNHYKILDKSELDWLPNQIKNCNLNFEVGFEVGDMNYFVTQNWQVMANNTDPRKMIQTFYEIINELNGGRSERLGDIKTKNVTSKLEKFGDIKESGLSKYQKVMIVIAAIGTVAGIIIGYVQLMKSN